MELNDDNHKKLCKFTKAEMLRWLVSDLTIGKPPSALQASKFREKQKLLGEFAMFVYK